MYFKNALKNNVSICANERRGVGKGGGEYPLGAEMGGVLLFRGICALSERLFLVTVNSGVNSGIGYVCMCVCPGGGVSPIDDRTTGSFMTLGKAP